MMDPPVALLVQQPDRNDDRRNRKEQHEKRMNECKAFVAKTNMCQELLADALETQDAVFPLELRRAVESEIGDLKQGYYAMQNESLPLSAEEYYQGCTTVLLARLFEQNESPAHVIASLSDCLNVTTKSSHDGDNARVRPSPPEPSFLSLVLVRGGSEGLATVDLQDLNQLFGILSTIQDRVVVLKDYVRPTKKNRKLQRLQFPTAKVTTSMLKMWVIPLVYIVGYTVYKSFQKQQRSISWNENIRPEIISILEAAFPHLRPVDYINTGLLLLQLDLLEDDVSSLPDDINTARVAPQLLDKTVFKPFVLGSQLPRYSVLARCCRAFLNRLDTDDTEHVILACNKLLQEEHVSEYLEHLNATRTINKENTPIAPALLEYEQSSGPSSQRAQLLAHGYPLLTVVDVLLVGDEVEKAIDVVVKMERVAALAEADRIEGWVKIFAYLLQTGQLFLDNFAERPEEYFAHRKIILEKIVPNAGTIGMSVVLNSYENLLDQAFGREGLTADELNYLCRACHQTVLRIMQSETNEDEGLDEFYNSYWTKIEDTPKCALWPTVTSSTKVERIRWACNLLLERNEVPESIRLPDSRRPDLLGMFKRGQQRHPTRLVLAGDEAAEEGASQEVHMEQPELEQLPPGNEEAPAANFGTGPELGAFEEATYQDDIGLQPDSKLETGDSEIDDDAGHDEEEEEAEVEEIADDDSESKDIVVIEDSDEDEEGTAENIESEDDEGDDGDETADEESVARLLATGTPEEPASDGEDSDVAVEDGDEEDDVHDQYAHQEDNEDQLMVCKTTSHDTAEEAEHDYASENQDEGYEPEDTHEYTEEEVSEAIHTEDEEEEQGAVELSHNQNREEVVELVEQPPKPQAALDSHTLSDMDYADEHTTEQEEDAGAESSELDEGDATDPWPSHPASHETAVQVQGESKSLVDFAKSAQRNERQHPPEEMSTTNANRPSVAWHWTETKSPGTEQPPTQPQQDLSIAAPSNAGDTNAAQLAESEASFLEGQSDLGTVEERDEVVVDHVPDSVTVDEKELAEDIESAVAEETDLARQALPQPHEQSFAHEELDAKEDALGDVVEEGNDTGPDAARRAEEEAVENARQVTVEREVAEAKARQEAVEMDDADAKARQEAAEWEADVKAHAEAEKARQVAAERDVAKRAVTEAEKARQEAAVRAAEAEKARQEAAERETVARRAVVSEMEREIAENAQREAAEKEASTKEEAEKATSEAAEAEKDRQEAAQREAAAVEAESERMVREAAEAETARVEAAEREFADLEEAKQVDIAALDKEPLQEDLTLSQLAGECVETPPQSSQKRTRKGVPDSLGGKSIDVGVGSPSISSIAPSVDDASEVYSPDRKMPDNPEQDTIGDAPRTARRSNRGAAKRAGKKRRDSHEVGNSGTPPKKLKAKADASVASATEPDVVQDSTSVASCLKRPSPDGGDKGKVPKKAKQKSESEPPPPRATRRSTRSRTDADDSVASSTAGRLDDDARAESEAESATAAKPLRATRARSRSTLVDEEPAAGRGKNESQGEESEGEKDKGSVKERATIKSDDASVSVSTKGTTRAVKRADAKEPAEESSRESRRTTRSTPGKGKVEDIAPAVDEEETGAGEPKSPRRRTRASSASDAADDASSQASRRSTRASAHKKAKPENDDGSDEKEAKRSTSSTTRAKAKGSKRAPASSALTTIPENEEVKVTPAKTRNTRGKAQAAPRDDESNGEADTKTKSTAAKPKRATRSKKGSSVDSDESDAASVLSNTVATRRKRSKNGIAAGDDESDAASVASNTAAKRGERTTRSKKATAAAAESDTDSRTATAKGKRTARSKKGTAAAEGGAEPDAASVASSTSGIRRSTRARKPAKK